MRINERKSLALFTVSGQAQHSYGFTRTWWLTPPPRRGTSALSPGSVTMFFFGLFDILYLILDKSLE